jgi:type 1 glutamine amidotransferase
MDMKKDNKHVTRRDLFKTAGFVAGGALVGAATEKAAQAQGVSPLRGTSKPRALALFGDRYHNQDYIRVSLTRLFKELEIPLDCTCEYDLLSRDLLKNYQVFVAFRNGVIWPGGYSGPDAYPYETDLENKGAFPPPVGINWMTQGQGQAIQDFVKAGNGLYAIHNVNIIGNTSKEFRDVMGGAFIGHPPLRPFQVRATANKHVITQGITPFMVTDEQHYVTYDKDPKYVILESENIDGLTYEQKGEVKAMVNGVPALLPAGKYGSKSIAGWAYDYGSGRVVYTAVGHTIHAMWAPQYFEIQKRSVKWLLKQI